MAAQQRLDQIRDLVNQWEQVVGFTAEVPDWMISEMADNMSYINGHAVQSLYDIGQYMSGHVGDDGAHTWHPEQAFGMPWAAFGMSHNEYQQRFESAADTYFAMTGKQLDKDTWGWYMRASEGQASGATMRSLVLRDGNAQQAFGWLKFGLDFQQFQQQKQQMQAGLGAASPESISDQQALLQLQYTHRNVAGSEATAQPTLTQQEKKTANVGVGQSEVR